MSSTKIAVWQLLKDCIFLSLDFLHAYQIIKEESFFNLPLALDPKREVSLFYPCLSSKKSEMKGHTIPLQPVKRLASQL